MDWCDRLDFIGEKEKKETQKSRCITHRPSRHFHCVRRLFSVSFLKSSDTSSANVTVHFLTVFYVIDFLYVYLESSSRLTVGVAYVVTGCLTFTANVTYSGHIKHLHFGLFFRGFSRLSDARFLSKVIYVKTSINNISFLLGKSNQK